MRCLVAARLSRLGDESTGIERQDEDTKRWARQGDHAIVATAADTDVSGNTDPWARAGLGPYLTDPALVATYDAIVASHVDRLARSTVHFMRLLHWADEHEKKIITLGEAGIDFSSAVGKLLGYIISWLGEQELAAIKRRYQGMREHLREGRWHAGKAVWGWQIAPAPDHAKRKRLVLDPELADAREEMISRGMRGDSYDSIVRWLHDAGVPSPSGEEWWTGSQVRRWLRNPILYGRQEDANGRVVAEADPAMDYAAWRRLQAVVGERRNPGGVSGNAMLAGILRCAGCKRSMYLVKSTAKGHEYRYMRCEPRKDDEVPCHNSIREEWLNDAVAETLLSSFGNREVVRLEVIPGAGHDAEVELVEADIRALDLDDPRFDDRLATLRSERARLLALPPDPDRVEEVPTGRTVAEEWHSRDTLGKRDYLNSARVKVYARRWRDTGMIDFLFDSRSPEKLWS